MSTLSGLHVTDCEGTIPTAGGYVFTGHLDQGPAPTPGPAVLQLGDLPVAGKILPGRGGLDNPDRPAFVFAAGAGWRNPLPAPGGAWASPTSVRLSDVLRVLAGASGEAYDPPPEAGLGTGYGWEAGTPADAVLADLVTRGTLPTWRMDPATGRTVFTPWPARGAADAQGQIDPRNLARGARTVAVSGSAAAFLPGATLQGAIIERVTFRDDGEQLHATVYDASDLAPLARLRNIVRKLFPFLARMGIDPATGNFFVRASDTRIDLAGGGPAALRVPDLPGFVFDPGIPGTTAPALYLTRDGGATFVHVAQVAAGSTVGGTVPPPPTTPTTPVAPTGSTKVTIG